MVMCHSQSEPIAEQIKLQTQFMFAGEQKHQNARKLGTKHRRTYQKGTTKSNKVRQRLLLSTINVYVHIHIHLLFLPAASTIVVVLADTTQASQALSRFHSILSIFHPGDA